MKKIIDHCLDHQGACAGIICCHALLCNKTGNGNMNQKKIHQNAIRQVQKVKTTGTYVINISCFFSTFALFKKAHLVLHFDIAVRW